MKTRLVRIGNSRGVRIPKPVIEQCGLYDRVDLTVRNGTVILSAARAPREGWDAAFKAMAKAGDDALLMGSFANRWDETEWTW